jgi:hypothetical protein
MTRKDKYQAYLKSSVWADKRAIALKRSPCCVLCSSTDYLQVHHRKYPSVLGEEPQSWLTVLCEKCHMHYHNKRAGRPKKKSKSVRRIECEVRKKTKKANTAKRAAASIKPISGSCKKCGGMISTKYKTAKDIDQNSKQKFFYSQVDRCKSCRTVWLDNAFKVFLS